MGRDHRGKPSGINKRKAWDSGPICRLKKLIRMIKMTDKYIAKEDKLADNVKLRHHHRNTDKVKPTTPAGYKQ